VITIFEGQKMLGLQDHHGQWWKVTTDCVRCGECCLDQGPNWHFAQDEHLGGCRYLEEEDDGKTYRCDLRAYRPLGCSINTPFVPEEYCKVRFKKVDSAEEVLSPISTLEI